MRQPLTAGDSHPRLGKIAEVFSPSSENLAAGIALAFLIVGAGLIFLFMSVWAIVTNRGALPVDADKGWSWIAVGLVSVVGFGLLVGGGLLVRFVNSLFALKIAFCDEGLVYSNRRGDQLMRWEDVDRIVEVKMSERPPIVKGPVKKLVPKVQRSSYRVESKQGESLPIDANTVNHIDRFGKMLRQTADRLEISWVMEEIRD